MIGQGVFTLTKDGAELVCDHFRFTSPVSEKNPDDIRVYYNETGSFDPAQSEETDMSLEAFWAAEPEYVDLPMEEFSVLNSYYGYGDGGF